jgi:hypothetical protein
LQEAEKAYLAGIIDGEGCITAFKNKGKKTVNPEFRIQMTDRNPIDLFSEYFGGNVSTHIPKEVKHKISYVYHTTGKKTHEILKLVTPYLKVKKSQAKMAMEIYNLKQVPNRKAVNHERIESLFTGIRKLNA